MVNKSRPLIMNKSFISIITTLCVIITISLSSCENNEFKDYERMSLAAAQVMDMSYWNGDPSSSYMYVYGIALTTEGRSLYDLEEGTEQLVICIFSEKTESLFPINGSYPSVTESESYILSSDELNMKCTCSLIDLYKLEQWEVGDSNNFETEIESANLTVDGNNENAIIKVELILEDGTTKNYYYEGPITFSEDSYEIG